MLKHSHPCLWLACLLGAPCAFTQETATLHATARLVPISAVVMDARGLPASGLAQGDFVLKQDGKEEPIRYLSTADELPLTLALLIDVSASQTDLIADEIKAADVFFETTLQRPQDRAMLVQFDSRIQQLKALTNDRALLHRALPYVTSGTGDDGGTRLIDAVDGVAEKKLAQQTGRKAIVLITDGGDTESRVSLKTAIEEAQRDNVAVYSICYRAVDAGLAGAPHHIITSFQDESDDLLRKLATETGGAVFRVSRKTPLQAILAQITDRLTHQYEIGYVPPPDTKTGRTHRLELKAKDPHLKVAARTGFFAAAP